MTAATRSGSADAAPVRAGAAGRPAVFLDRDGVLNVDVGYAFRPEQIVWVAGAERTVASLKELGYLVFVVTNQAGVARGYYGLADVHALHHWMAEHLAAHGGRVDEWRYCPSHPEGVVPRYARNDERRKPAPGMLLDLLRRRAVDRHRSFLVGDRDSDVKAARLAGIDGYRFDGGDLWEFTASILAERDARRAATIDAGT